MPWKILGLESDATERDVKRAYARLLKLHRPDKDPEGFAKINEAYEEAKRLISWRGEDEGIGVVPAALVEAFPHLVERCEVDDSGFEGGIELPVEVVDPAVSIVYESLPEVFFVRRSSLERALAAGDCGRIGEAMTDFARVCVDYPDCIPAWGNAVSSIFVGSLAGYLSLLPQLDLLRELEFGASGASMAKLTYWEAGNDFREVEEFAQSILADGERYDHPAVADCLIRIARLLAVPKFDLAVGLTDLVFTRLTLEERVWKVQPLEGYLQVAGHFQNLPYEDQVFWGIRLANGDRGWDWTSAESEAAMKKLVKLKLWSWRGFEPVDLILPEEARVRFGEFRAKDKGYRREVRKKAKAAHCELMDRVAAENLVYAVLSLPAAAGRKLRQFATIGNLLVLVIALKAALLYLVWWLVVALMFQVPAWLYQWLLIYHREDAAELRGFGKWVSRPLGRMSIWMRIGLFVGFTFGWGYLLYYHSLPPFFLGVEFSVYFFLAHIIGVGVFMLFRRSKLRAEKRGRSASRA